MVINLLNMKRINSLLGIDISVEIGPELLEFLILWNLYEKRLFNNRFSITEAIRKDVKVSSASLDAAFDYFKKRYIENGQTNSKFDALSFRRNDKKSNVVNILCGVPDVILNRSTAVQIIIYRLRNNLFHGLKEVETLSSNKATFLIVNEFLLSCLEENK